MVAHIRPAIEDENATPTPGQGRVVRLVTEWRACASCGYDLRGQGVILDDKYGWTITRCPECGRVEPLQAVQSVRFTLPRAGAAAALAWIGLVLWMVVAFGVGLFTISESAMVVWIGGPDWYSNAYYTPLTGLVETLWTIPVSLVSWGILFGLMPHLRRTQQWQLVALVVGVMVCAWGVFFGPFLGSVRTQMGGYWSPYGDASYMILAMVQPVSLITSALVVGEAVLVMALVRPLARWGLARFAPAWVILALQGLWRAEGLEPPRRAGSATEPPSARRA